MWKRDSRCSEWIILIVTQPVRCRSTLRAISLSRCKIFFIFLFRFLLFRSPCASCISISSTALNLLVFFFLFCIPSLVCSSIFLRLSFISALLVVRRSPFIACYVFFWFGERHSISVDDSERCTLRGVAVPFRSLCMCVWPQAETDFQRYTEPALSPCGKDRCSCHANIAWD